MRSRGAELSSARRWQAAAPWRVGREAFGVKRSTAIRHLVEMGDTATDLLDALDGADSASGGDG